MYQQTDVWGKKPFYVVQIAVFFTWILLSSTHAFAQHALEIITLQHRTAENVLPSLQPFLVQGGVLTGQGNQLFLRTSPENKLEIKRVLATLDVPARRLLVRVTTDRHDAERGTQLQARSQGARVLDSRDSRQSQAMQTVQTVDGGQAFIQTGVSVAIPFRGIAVGPGGVAGVETVEFRDISRGFFVRPSVVGNSVSVEITQQADTPNRQGPAGSANLQRLSTRVSGQLGEWLHLGGTGQNQDNRGRSNASLSTSNARSDQGIWLMVEEIR